MSAGVVSRPRVRCGALGGRLVGTVVAAVGLFLILGVGPAFAHASLVETTPLDGQEIEVSPRRVTLTFNEPINAPTGGLRVFDGQGERVDGGIQEDLTADTVSVDIGTPLEDGGYVATYRVVSEDGHVIRGAFVYQVGGGSAIDDATLAALFAGGGDTLLSLGAGLARALSYGGVLLLAGGSFWLVVIARRRDDRDQARQWVRRGAWSAVIGTVMTVPLQAMLSSGLGAAALGNPTLLTETVGGSVGIAAVVRLAAVTGVLVSATRPRAMLGFGVVALLSFVVDGHTRTVEPAWLMLTGAAVHVTAAALWGAGLLLLLLAVRRRRRSDDPAGAARLVASFSRVAGWSVLALVVAGSAMSWANVRQLRAITTTDYGWTLLAKVAIAGVIGLVGLYNNRVLVPAVVGAIPRPAGGSSDIAPAAATSTSDVAASGVDPARADAAWKRFGVTLRYEAVGVLLVLAVTAFLVNLRPAADEAGITGAFDTYVQVTEELAVNLVVDPNRAGANEIHMYVFDQTGRPLRSDDLEEVILQLALPERDLGPIERTPFVAGPGHWQVDGRDLALPGEWELTVQLDIDRFTREQVVIPVVVNP